MVIRESEEDKSSSSPFADARETEDFRKDLEDLPSGIRRLFQKK